MTTVCAARPPSGRGHGHKVAGAVVRLRSRVADSARADLVAPSDSPDSGATGTGAAQLVGLVLGSVSDPWW